MTLDASWDVRMVAPGVSLRGLCVVDEQVVWASGTQGTVLRSTDGGASWQSVGPAGVVALDFRDVHGFDEERAVICSAGQPARVYRTDDGGARWQLVHEDTRRAAFFDALAFLDADNGLLYADPIDGRANMYTTADGGRSWSLLPQASVPKPLEGEAAFAASGTCVLAGDGCFWVATGGRVTRLFSSADAGGTWSVAALPLLHGRASTGAFSLAFADALHGVAVGGDYRQPGIGAGTAAMTDDGGISWVASPVGAGGYRSGVTFVPGAGAYVAVGSHGCSLSLDGGWTWRELSAEGFHAVGSSGEGRVWAVGSEGRVAQLRL
ncbi:MAG: oxidoreductase [Planctomycetota bacterium]|nr:oxidoreductase [Planctomycetota bacterium]